MIATTNTNVSTGQNAKQKEIPSAEKIDMRDYFAAKAMQASATNETGANGFTFEQRAEWAYLQADAMIKEREK